MPLPQRKPDESHDEFIERCMGDAVMVEEFPDAAQRRAVCERQGKVRTEAHLNLVCDPGSITIEAVEDGPAEGRPRLPRFSMVAYTGGPMRIAGWRYPVVVDLAGLAIPSQSRPIRFGHDMASGVGHTDAIRIEDGRLVATGVVSRDTQAAREIVASARNGFPWQASIGAAVEEFEFVKENQKVLVNGRQFSGPVNVVRKATLGEISFVDLGADGATSASLAAAGLQASQKENQAMESLSDTNPQVQPGEPADTRVAADGGDSGPTPQVPSPKPQTSDAQAAEAARVLAVRMICGGKHPQIESQAIQEHWDISRTALAVLREERPKVPAVHVRSAEVVTERLLEAACMLTAKAAQVEELFDEPTLEAATRRFRGGIGLQELLLEAAWANGYPGRNFRDSRAVLRFAFRPELEAGFSTIDIGGILSNVANKFLLDGFFSVERTWRNICAVRNVSDFKTVTSYRLIGTDQYEQVAPGGELKHGTLGNETYTNKADTYGLVLSIDRRDIINDDLGAITTVPRKLGRGSGLKINDVFWSTFLDNANFFTAANRNYLEGADTALSIDGLTKAEVAFMDQVDSDGKPIGIMPAILLVPTALSAIGSQLYKSMELRDTTSNKSYPVANPHQGKFRVEVSRYLSNSQYAGSSSKAWYLLATPDDLPVIEVAFLNGQESPTIETADADFSVLGIQMRGVHDFGIALQDPRGGVKLKGES
ncbi:phage major capsid protein [Thermopirellula anaerolimosa]